MYGRCQQRHRELHKVIWQNRDPSGPGPLRVGQSLIYPYAREAPTPQSPFRDLGNASGAEPQEIVWVRPFLHNSEGLQGASTLLHSELQPWQKGPRGGAGSPALPPPPAVICLGKSFSLSFFFSTQEKILVVPITRKTKSSVGHQRLPAAGNNVQAGSVEKAKLWGRPEPREDTGPGLSGRRGRGMTDRGTWKKDSPPKP